MKLVGQAAQYEWLKVNIFTHWVASSNQLSVLVFDAHPSLPESIAASFLPLTIESRRDPFWAYTKLMDEVARLEDVTVMAIRNYVRAIEKEAPQEKPEPPYRFLHDISRHAVHVTETLDVAVETMDGMLSLHESVKAQVGDDDIWQTVHGRLLFSQQLLKGLRWRSKANEKRLQNEIQLAFHMVTQYDSGVSVAIGKAAKEDSAAMKTISMLTLAFLPPTFISSIFSMSFFKFDADTGWTISNNFWIYWAWAVPTTLVTSALWYYWQKQRIPGRSQAEKGPRPERQSLSLCV
ncbi:Amino acid/polyamine transporter I [Apiospora rasikravindrae]|uniref:Amino acid/polyamine transporter I n=1 Tax=Apiospora rasikravindrae TaxID=990691 RepID=A0ABR1SQS7_9PEZI